MAPWTGKQIQSNLDKLTANNIDETAFKLVNLLESRSQLQKLALLVSHRVQRAYTPTFHLAFDVKRRHIADSLIASLLRCFASLRKSIKGVPTKEGLSGIPLFKTDLLGAALFEKTGIAAVATSLYNTLAMSSDEIQAIIFACLDKGYANDTDKVGQAILLLEYAAREIDGKDRSAMDKIMDLVQERLDSAPEIASERKKCSERLIPSLYDRYWDLVQKRKESWRESPYATSVNPSTVTASAAFAIAATAAAATTTSTTLKEDQIPEVTSLPSLNDMPATPVDNATITLAQQSLWLSGFAPIEVNKDRKRSDAKVSGAQSPTRKETQQSNSSLPSSAGKTLKRCPSCSREVIPTAQTDDEYARVAYGQAIGDPDYAKKDMITSEEPLPNSKANPTLTFDDDDDCLTLHLDVQVGSPIKVKFDSDFRLGDAKKIAKIFASSIISISMQSEQSMDSIVSISSPSAAATSSSSSSSSSPPIHFLPNGRVGQMLNSSTTLKEKDIFVQYPHTMTLLQARKIGDTLAAAVESYSN